MTMAFASMLVHGMNHVPVVPDIIRFSPWVSPCRSSVHTTRACPLLPRAGAAKQGMVWLDGGDHEAALACFEEACTVDGANASVHFYKTVALVKVHMSVYNPGGGGRATPSVLTSRWVFVLSPKLL